MQPTTPAGGSTSFWRTLPGLLTALAALLTAIGTLVAALATAGFFDTAANGSGPTAPPVTSTSEAPPPEPPPEPTQESSPEPPPEPATVAADLAAIDLVYSGDAYGCVLQITVDVGGRSAQPTGNRFTMREVPTGPQDYAISGTISCAVAGFCTASGEGVIDVVDGRSYSVSWQNTGIGQCRVSLTA